MTRLAIVKQEKCSSIKCGHECMKYCPMNRRNLSCVSIGEDAKAKIQELVCTGCNICVKRCPFGAIAIINLPEALKEKPILRYGENAFELFRLPVPQKGQVVGLLGANGIGKTTAIEILSGKKKPNLGNFVKDISEKEILEHFRGSELLNYFKALFSSGVKISYKKQYVDELPKNFPGKVSDFLEKTGSRKIRLVADNLSILNLLGRELKSLSGGELQKVAIAECILRDADLYLFDEPASYLDIKERINVAKAIQELAKEKAVLVAEHDLIILDYLTDLVHIFFGEAGCYGVVSHPLSSKNGINAYLDGYLKDENLRFRDEGIKFETSLHESQGRELFFDWPVLKKSLGNFALEVEPSGIYRKEVVGIIGANGIGKTTFARLLAGELKPDEGEVSRKIKISYKPQYLQAAVQEISVGEAFAKIQKEFLSQENKLNILRPLEVEALLSKKLNELSGGELQRVAISACLLRPADLYLLDEPSTYLDVEQRLSTAKAIQKCIKAREGAAIVIDHDLLFASQISDRILVFSGKPAEQGIAGKIEGVKAGLNKFLKELGITMRKDPDTNRPRVNKPDSVKDREQRSSNRFYDV